MSRVGVWMAGWPRGVSRHLPAEQALALHAAMSLPSDLRVKEIDRITDLCVKRGFCRPRSDLRRHAEWLRSRPTLQEGST